MDEISFKKGAEGYMAEYTSEGRTMVQIQGVKSGRLTISQFIDTMEPVTMETVNFTNTVIEINVPAGMKVRLLSDVEVKKVKALVIKDSAAAGGGGGGESYVLPKATDSALGGIQTGYSENSKNYAVKVDGSGKEFLFDLSGMTNKYGNIIKICTFQSNVYIVFRNGNILDLSQPENTINMGIDELEKAGVLASA